MLRRRAGHIVNTSSVSGLIPAPGFTAYSATKHAVVGLSRGLRIEAARHGVKVSAVCPGFINTEIVDNADYRGIDGPTSVADSPVRFGSPESCARQALRGVARNEAEIVITPHAKGMVAMQRFAPRVNEVLGRIAVKRAADKL
jgi:short-subunit dehydrogenase